ncbi:DnaJ C-terminal domain-containing protein [Peterkaempfera bronchialis]|uniref:J domain-containing protein n=1 Tax=Peterkaempfera bronchialis TaxID=2126346 RepID=A0A345SS06_9ACTN|nr:J domain-containing protein [Peterkaempfera bronchialis]AXI76511.1 J domain-containing protein [Peterkaempfera bronchialis]
MARDYYEALGVPRGASADEIQQAFRRLARRHHPDVNRDPAAEERFKEINEAYQVLSEPSTRARYDRFGENFRQVPEDWEERVAAGAGAGAGPGGRGPFGGARGRVWTGGGGDGGIDLDDLFGGFFGARGATGPIPGADQQAELPLTVEEAYRGGRHRVTLRGPGRSGGYEVEVPPGTVDGQRIRLAGEGGRGSGRGPSGDLYLVVRIAPHPRYRLDGRNIHVPLPVTPWEAALGATVPLEAPGGTLKVHIPAGSSTGRRLRLRGQGMPNPHGAPGDLYAEVRVMVPPSLGPRERELFQELAAESSFDPRRQP